MANEQQKMMCMDWAKLDARLLWCHEGHVNKEDNVRTQSIQFSEHANSGAWLVRSGWAKVQHGEISVTAEPGQWLIPKPCARIQSFATQTVILSIGFKAEWPDNTHLFDEGLSTVLDGSAYPALEETAIPLLKCVEATQPTSWNFLWHSISLTDNFAIQGLFGDWLIALSESLEDSGILARLPMSYDRRVNATIRFLQNHSTHQPLDLQKVAEYVGLSLSQLNRVFRSATNTTPSRYYDQILYARACRLLNVSELTIQDVASHLGFTHLSHFSLWFKKHAGVSPRQFRSVKST